MPTEKILHRDTFFATLPDEWQTDLMPEIQGMIAEKNSKIVVLDDDPTGTQTVHDVTVLTAWSVDALSSDLLCCKVNQKLLNQSYEKRKPLCSICKTGV